MAMKIWMIQTLILRQLNLGRTMSDWLRKNKPGPVLTGHPIDQYEPELKHFTHGKIASLQVSRGNMEARVAGLVVEVRTRQTKNGKTMGFATWMTNPAGLSVRLLVKFMKNTGIFTVIVC